MTSRQPLRKPPNMVSNIAAPREFQNIQVADDLFDTLHLLDPQDALRKLEREGFKNLKPDFTDRTQVMARDDVGVVFKIQLFPQPMYRQFANSLCYDKCTALTHPNLPQILENEARITMMERLIPYPDNDAATNWNFELYQVMLAYGNLISPHPKTANYDIRSPHMRQILKKNPRILNTAKFLISFMGSPRQIRLDDVMCRQDGTYVVLETPL